RLEEPGEGETWIRQRHRQRKSTGIDIVFAGEKVVVGGPDDADVAVGKHRYVVQDLVCTRSAGQLIQRVRGDHIDVEVPGDGTDGHALERDHARVDARVALEAIERDLDFRATAE